MDILVSKISGGIVERFNAAMNRVKVPGVNHPVGVHGKPLKRPLELPNDHYMASVTVNYEPIGTDQKKGDAVEIVDNDAMTVSVTYPAIDLTPQEIEDRNQNNDISELSQSVDKLAFIQTELISKLLDGGTISATDFTVPVRKIYQDIKKIVDRAKPKN